MADNSREAALYSDTFEAAWKTESNGTVALTVSTRFGSADGSETHSFLIEAKEGWTIEVPDGYTPLSSNYEVNGVEYVQIGVDNSRDGNPTLTVILTPDEPVIGEGGTVLNMGVLSQDSNGGATVAIAEEPLEVTWSNTAQFVLSEGTMAGVSGDVLQFRLSLQNGEQAMYVATPIVLSFVVTNDTDNFLVPDRWTFAGPIDIGHGNTMTWTKDTITGDYILTATLAPGQSVLDISFEAYHATARPGVINPDQTLYLTLKNVSTLDSEGYPVWPDGLAHAINAGDLEHQFTVGDQFVFTIEDVEYAQIAAYGIGHEAYGMQLAQVDASGIYDGSQDMHGQVIVGTDGDNTIYATQGNNIFIGGDGHNTFVWNNTNMGHGEDAKDIIKDFDVNHCTLRFDDLFGGSHDANETLDKLLNGTLGECSWENGTFFATDGSTSIELKTQGATATLRVSYEYEGQPYAQTVELGGYDISPLLNQDEKAVANLLHEIIKIGG